MMLPQLVETQNFLNSGDLDWTITIETPGDCPPAGAFFARMATDPAAINVDYIFSERRGSLIRGAVDASAQTMHLRFFARASAIAGLSGPYTVDLLYLRGDDLTPVMRTIFDFVEGV